MTLAQHIRASPLGTAQLAKLLDQLQRQAGITLDSPRSVIQHHVQERMAALGLNTVDEYLAVFDDGFNGRAEWLALVDLLTVKETRFFRQPEALACVADYLKEVLDSDGAPKELSFWSAGCSTGEECYSLGMVIEDSLRRHSPFYEWHGVGTDLSFQAIATAQQATYSGRALETLPLRYRDSYVQQTGHWGYQIVGDVRTRCHFFHSNLLHSADAPFADFNIVFCQNVLIYFDRRIRHWIIDQLVQRLRTGGLMVLGAGEDALWSNPAMQRLGWPGVCAYIKTGE